MEELIKKLTQLTELIKAVKAIKPANPAGAKLPTLPPIRPPAPPSMTPSGSASAKIPGMAPGGKKDPKKIAEQIKNGSMSTKTQKVMLKAQWSNEDVEKADEAAGHTQYHIHQGPHKITSEPMTLGQIKAKHGSVLHLENNGFRLIPHKPVDKKV